MLRTSWFMIMIEKKHDSVVIIYPMIINRLFKYQFPSMHCNMNQSSYIYIYICVCKERDTSKQLSYSQLPESWKFVSAWLTISPANTRSYLDINSTFFECYGRRMNVKTTFCAYWPVARTYPRFFKAYVNT